MLLNKIVDKINTPIHIPIHIYSSYSIHPHLYPWSFNLFPNLRCPQLVVCARVNVSKRQAVLLFVFEYTSFNLFPNWRFPPHFETKSGVAIRIQIYVERVQIFLMASWNDETEWAIRGLFTNRFAPKRYRGVTGVTMVMGELVWGWGVSGGRNNGNIGNVRP